MLERFVYCPGCGQRNPAEVQFCPACGSSVVTTAYQPASPKPETSDSEVYAEVDADRPAPSLDGGLRYLVYRGLAIVIALLYSGVLIGTYLLVIIVTVLGAFLWVGIKGRWPGRRRSVNPVVRRLFGVVAAAVNALIGLGAASLYYGFEYEPSPTTAILIGLVFFVGVSVLEALAIQLFVWADKSVRYLWSAASHDGTSYKLSAREG
jgi:hypothetical protein